MLKVDSVRNDGNIIEWSMIMDRGAVVGWMPERRVQL